VRGRKKCRKQWGNGLEKWALNSWQGLKFGFEMARVKAKGVDDRFQSLMSRITFCRNA
jgi:hypothetical protein